MTLLIVVLIAVVAVFGYLGMSQQSQMKVQVGLNILSAIAGLVFLILVGIILFALFTA